MLMPTLYIFSGLPGTGKTTLSQLLSSRLGAVHLRIDTIEQALRDLCDLQVEGEGYRLAYRLAADNLRLGLNVVSDSCNPIHLTRREWERCADSAQANYVNIEITCSNSVEHQRRVESRVSTSPSLQPPTWEQVMRREYDAWSEQRIVVDTAGHSPQESWLELTTLLPTFDD